MDKNRKKTEKDFLSEVFEDGKDLKRGILAIFFVMKFLANFKGKKLKIVQDYEQMNNYLRTAERCVCDFCVANIDHQIPLLSLNDGENGKQGRKEGFLDSAITCPPILGNIISRVEYQTIFLMVLKKEQEIYFKKQIEMLESGLELPYTDPLARASPFIDEKQNY